MKRMRILFWMTGILFAAGVSAAAQHGHSAAPKPAHPSTPHATAPATHGGAALKPVHSTQGASHGSSAKMQKPVKPMGTPKTNKPATTTKAAKPTKPVKSPKPVETTAASKTSKKDAKSGTTTTPATGTGSAGPELTAVQTKLQKNTNLAAKLTSRLPAGADLMTAASGFKNLGQFVAAVNVSNNLAIPFAQLKTKIVTDGLSLGQAIQSLRPVSSATVEAQRAEYDARGMIAESEQQQAAATASGTTAATKKAKDKPKSKKTAGSQPGS